MATTVDEALAIAKEIGYPVIVAVLLMYWADAEWKWYTMTQA